MENWLAPSPWPGVILWIILYVSDYYLTIYSARGFREIGHFQFEGSFELTPLYQKDVDALKLISKRHIILLILYSLLIILLWWLARFLFMSSWVYLFYLGMFLLLEVAVHVRHLRNVLLIREVRRNGGLEGQLSYRKWFSYKVSAFEMYLSSALFLIVWAFTFSPLFLGGAVMCFGTGIKHGIMSRKAKAGALQAVETQL